ncbi:MAG: 6-carboxy-5,6,7,8-tetrahydropterin synthase [Pelotomaculum sp. PtaB.Bin104]|nr:MAG: 6-carboxy-5,6,7,8-tetrahydropterin synthase [Pelotomaculum sp. PtaB.Bin104]
MYELMIRTNFAAAHSLRDYNGPCARLHGHTWQVEVVLTGRQLDSYGMLVDFRELKSRTKKIIEELDHQDLNALEPFAHNNGGNPTAENLSRYLFERLKAKFSSLQREVKITLVRVCESPEACAAYWEED